MVEIAGPYARNALGGGTLAVMGDWWTRNIIEPHKLPLLLCFMSFVVTFLLTRAITRLIRAGRGPFKDVTPGGLHIHHSVPGLILLLIGAAMAVGGNGDSPWHEVAAVAVGVGASLVLDEFALILHLDDVYWAKQGQLSVQAVALTSASLACLLVGLTPFGVDDTTDTEINLRIYGILGIAITIVAVIVCATKGKYRLALVSVFVPWMAIIGAIRLARPTSPWARHVYRSRPRRMQRAVHRSARFDRRWDPIFTRLGDAIAGSPSNHPVAHPPAAAARTSTPDTTKATVPATTSSAPPRPAAPAGEPEVEGGGEGDLPVGADTSHPVH